jgi:hypothetical protein
LREEQILEVFEDIAVMRVSGPKKKEVAGGWMKLDNELHNMYSSPYSISVIISMRMGWCI